MPDLSTARGIARTLGAELPANQLRVLHKQLTDYFRTAAGGVGGGAANWGGIGGTLSNQTDLQAELDRGRITRYFLGE